MNIFIKNVKIEIQGYEDIDYLLQLYSLSNNKITLPKYLIVSNDVDFIEGEKIEVNDIRDDLKGLSFDEIHFDTLKMNYIQLNIKDIFLLWIIENKIQLSDDLIQDISFDTYYKNTSAISSDIDNFITKQQNEFNALKEIFAIETYYLNLLGKYESHKCGEISIEEIKMLYRMEFLRDVELLEIFDSMKVSIDLPFICIRNSMYDGDLYKIYENKIPDESWIDCKTSNDLNFYISSEDGDYTVGFFRGDGNIEINHKSNFYSNYLIEKLLSTIDKSLKFKYVGKRQLKIRARFILPDSKFDKAIFTDMLINDPIIKQFFIVNEYNKTMLDKTRYAFYYSFANKYNPLSMILTHNNIDDSINVRIINANNVQQVHSLRESFCRIWKIYLERKDDVLKQYILFIPEALKVYDQKKKKKKLEDKKSGKRLLVLKERNPYVFRSGYAGMCFKDQQPYIINSSKVKEYEEKYGKHKIMEFRDREDGISHYYACEPREKDETNTFLYPGLSKNTRGNIKYRKEVPLIPCCFAEDQYTKGTTELYKRIYGKKSIKKDKQYLLSSNKQLPEGRIGLLSELIEYIVVRSGINMIKARGKKVYPILRYGVMSSPDSLFHCTELAFNKSYIISDRAKRENAVMELRKKLSTMDFSVGKQELFDFNDQEIKSLLLDRGKYIDAQMMISLLEKYYDCNIFLLGMDGGDKDETFLIPRNNKVYLYKGVDKNKSTIFIIRYSTEMSIFPQYEILVNYTKKINNKSFLFPYNSFVESMNDFFIKINKNFIIKDGNLLSMKM